MVDNVAVTPGVGATIATDDVGGVQYQRVKMDIGGDGVSSPVTSANPLPMTQADVSAIGFYPGFTAPPVGETRSQTFDELGALYTRGGVTTDEGSFRLNFSGASTSRSLGTCTFTNGSRTVTGTGFTTANPPFQVGDYARLTANGDSAYTRVYSIDSDTTLTLDSTYSGAGGTGASDVAPYKPTMGTGGSISVASGLHTLTCGTTAAVTHYVIREVDYGPLVWQSVFNLSQRIANQDIYRGLFDHPSATMRTYCRFHFTGTTNTTVICETGWAETAPASGNDQQATTVTLPDGLTTASQVLYRIELRSEVVSFYINTKLVATHRNIAPKPYDVLCAGTVCANGTTPGSSTTVNVTTELCNNLDSLRISIANDTDSLLASPPQMTQTLNYNVAGVIAINTDLGFIDTMQCGAVIVQCISMGTTGVVTPAFTGDDGTTYNGAQLIPIAGGASATTFNAAGMWVIPVSGPRLRLRLTTATTAGTTTIRAWCTALAPTIIPTSLTVTATNLSCNAAQWAGATPLNPVANGSTNRALVAAMATAVSNTDQSATAYAGAGRVNGTVVAAATGAGGAVITAEINASVVTLGTATHLVFVLQESNGGTNFTDIWTSDPVTTTGIIRVPAVPVAGRRRWCCHSVGGTSTTVTVTITTLELPAGYVRQMQYREKYSATNPFASVINSATQSATTLVDTGATCMTATSQITSPCVVEGCKAVTMFITLANGPTVTTQPVLTLQFSNDLTNWWSSTATITGAGNNTYAATSTNSIFRYARIAVTTAAAYSAGNYTISSVGINGVN